MARQFIIGDKELDATLEFLADKEGDKIARSVLGSGLSVIAKAMRKAAPVGPTGTLKKAIGKRLEKGKRGRVFTAKAGINVGKTTKKETAAGGRKRAPHSHLVVLGTKPRYRTRIGGRFAFVKNPTQQQLFTGVMPPNPFISQATESSRGAVRDKMKKQFAKVLAKSVKKRASKGLRRLLK